jgi:hypothetical protein
MDIWVTKLVCIFASKGKFLLLRECRHAFFILPLRIYRHWDKLSGGAMAPLVHPDLHQMNSKMGTVHCSLIFGTMCISFPDTEDDFKIQMFS